MATKAKPPSKPPGNLSPLEFLAISVAGKNSKTWRHLVDAVHAQQVDFVVRIQGQLHVAEGQTATVREKPDVEELLGRVLENLGPKTRETVVDALVAAHKAADEAPELSLHAAMLAKRTISELTLLNTQQRAGNVSGELTVDKVKR